MRESEKVFWRPIAAVVALEYQRNGWPHFHGLADLGGLAGWEIEVMGRLWFKIGGGNKIREVCKSGADAVAVYCAKYLNKDLRSGDVIFTSELARKRRESQHQLRLAQQRVEDLTAKCSSVGPP